jgi:uncharacterized membrane protein YphA (DoxX/SURF4 family)
MNGNLMTLVRRALFATSFVLAGLGVLERILHSFRYTILGGYPPARMLELAAEALLFVIALELRELLHAQKRG